MGITGFVLAWGLASATISNATLLPAPAKVYAALIEMVRTDIAVDIAVSLAHLGTGYAIGITLGLLMAILAVRFAAAGTVIEPMVEVLRPISAIAWIPIAILMFGVSDAVPVFLIAYAAAFPIFINTLDGIRRLDAALLDAARSLGASPNFVTLRVVLPGALPYAMTGARLSLGLAWMAMVAGELVGADAGLGWRIMWYQEFFAMDKVMAIILVIGVLGFLADVGLRGLQRALLHWNPVEP
ncbi:MAG: ABC transporter permease [Pseudomonadota bacterium]